MTLRYCILDLETEGLDPNRHAILEIGAIMVDEELRELGRFHGLINRPYIYWDGLDPVVQKMHADNGLRAQIEGGLGMPVTEVEAELVEWIRYHAEGQPVQLAGFSIHFDRTFLAAQMPRVVEALHYRQVDISCLVIELERLGVKVTKPGRMPHRGLEDAEIELVQWRKARAAVRELVARPQVVSEFDAKPLEW